MFLLYKQEVLVIQGKRRRWRHLEARREAEKPTGHKEVSKLNTEVNDLMQKLSRSSQYSQYKPPEEEEKEKKKV